MNNTYLIAIAVFICLCILLLYHIYCLFDLGIYRKRVIKAMGEVEQKHINIYRAFLKLQAGGISRTKLVNTAVAVVKLKIRLKVVTIISVINLLLAISSGLVAMSVYSISNSMSAIALVNRNIIMKRNNEDSWVDSKDDDRHNQDSDDTDEIGDTEEDGDSMPDEDLPDGKLVKVIDYIPDIELDIRYATTNNFTKQVIYDDSEAYLCFGTVKKLRLVQDELKDKGYKIIIWDAYRPVEAQERLWEVYPDPVYVADPRNGITSHSKGNTIDLGILYSDGSEVELPSGFDDFSLKADRVYDDVSEEAAKNSQMLEEIMESNGFKGYSGEWWHYQDNEEYIIEE